MTKDRPMNNIKKSGAVMLALVISLSSSLAYAEQIWVDIRTPREIKLDHIEGDLQISHFDIDKEIMRLYPDRSTEIGLYGSNGSRSGIAMFFLKAAGYEHVLNVETINNARKIRGLAKPTKKATE